MERTKIRLVGIGSVHGFNADSLRDTGKLLQQSGIFSSLTV